MIDPNMIFNNHLEALTELILVYNDPSLHHLRAKAHLAVSYLKTLIQAQDTQVKALQEIVKNLKAELAAVDPIADVTDSSEMSTQLSNPALQVGKKKRI